MGNLRSLKNYTTNLKQESMETSYYTKNNNSHSYSESDPGLTVITRNVCECSYQNTQYHL